MWIILGRRDEKSQVVPTPDVVVKIPRFGNDMRFVFTPDIYLSKLS